MSRSFLPITLLAAAILVGCGDARTSERQGRFERDAVLADGLELIEGARIVRVIDGDTLHVRPRGSAGIVKVRLVGIDAPETTTLRTGSAECGGDAAAAAARDLARQSPVVTLRTDSRQGARDRYGRLLAYVEPRDTGVISAATFQEALLAGGWAAVYRSRDGFDRGADLERAADAARTQRRGLWRSCGGDFRRPLAN